MKLLQKQLLIAFYCVMSCMFFCESQAFDRTFTVNSDGYYGDNVADGICSDAIDGSCTLNAAIQEANRAPGFTTLIQFDGQYTISGGGGHFNLTAGNTTIDASTQWDTVNDIPGVQVVDGYASGPGSTFLTLDSNNNHIYGIAFSSENFNDITAIKIAANSGNNIIGAETEKHRNVFRVSGTGVHIDYGSTANTINSNYFGTSDRSLGSMVSGTYGIRNYGQANHISNNLIVGQNGGILLSGSFDSTIDSNIIGATNPVTSEVLANEDGMVIEFSQGNDINNNIIGSNTRYGVSLTTNAINNDIHGNSIGRSLQGGGNQSHGIFFNTTSGNGNSIRENDIRENSGSGIYLSTGPNPSIKDNTIRSNQRHGIHLAGSSSVTISGNFIGQTSGGGDHGNLLCGILLDSGATGNTIGGNSAADANWIGFNYQDGIRLSGNSTTGNTVRNNITGAQPGFVAPAPNKQNGIAIFEGAYNNQIGFPGAGNTILANNHHGVMIKSSDGNWLYSNMIGTDGTHNWGNSLNGIYILQSEDTNIWSNEVAYNNPSSTNNNGGIVIAGNLAINNTIAVSSIHDNGGEGIELLDGANFSITPPVITREEGQVSGTACSNCIVEIFSDAHNEGRFFEGYAQIDPAGKFSWTEDFQGKFLTATATDLAGNTSMFSTPVPAIFPWMMFMPAIFEY